MSLTANRLLTVLAVLAEAANFKPGNRVKSFKGSLSGVVRKILPDGRVVWLPDGNETELTALPESLLWQKSNVGSLLTNDRRVLDDCEQMPSRILNWWLVTQHRMLKQK